MSNLDTVEIRLAKVEDIPAIQDVGHASRQVAYVDTGLVTSTENDEIIQTAWSVDALTSSMTHPENHAIVAIADNKVVGYLSGRYQNPSDQGQVRLYRIYLHPAYWGRQIGWEMWHHYRAAIDPSVKRIDVGVFATNLRAMNFYRRLGFRIIGTDNGTCQLQMQLT